MSYYNQQQSQGEMVTCALHGRSRLSKFCVQHPVLDAFGKVIRTRYECLDTSSCLKGNIFKAKEREENLSTLSRPLDADLDNLIEGEKITFANVDTNLPSSPLTAAAAAAVTNSSSNMGPQAASSGMGDAEDSTKVSDFAKIITAGSNRYYDLSRIGDANKDEPFKKLCFICGQSGHERPKCPNVVCRRCRLPGCQGIPGVCVPQASLHHPCSLLGTPSLAKNSTQLGFAGSTIIAATPPKDAADENNNNNKGKNANANANTTTTNTPPLYIGVRCTLCRQEGHVDCAHLENPKKWVEQCLVCGRTGHHGFKCPSRRMDRWMDDMKRKISGGVGNYNNNNNNTNYQQQQGGYFSDSGYNQNNNNNYRGGNNNNDSSSYYRGGGADSSACFNCGQPGHLSRDCPKPRGGGGGTCFNCGEAGHMSRDCPKPRGGGGGGGNTSSRYPTDRNQFDRESGRRRDRNYDGDEGEYEEDNNYNNYKTRNNNNNNNSNNNYRTNFSNNNNNSNYNDDRYGERKSSDYNSKAFYNSGNNNNNNNNNRGGGGGNNNSNYYSGGGGGRRR